MTTLRSEGPAVDLDELAIEWLDRHETHESNVPLRLMFRRIEQQALEMAAKAADEVEFDFRKAVPAQQHHGSAAGARIRELAKERSK